MQAFTVSVEVSCRESALTQTVDALVGGGNALATMPSSLLHRLGIQPDETMHFRAQDGGRTELLVGHAHFSVQGVEVPARVVFGPEDRGELGTNTLSSLLLGPDPAMLCLVPAMGLLPGIFLIGDEGLGN